DRKAQKAARNVGARSIRLTGVLLVRPCGTSGPATHYLEGQDLEPIGAAFCRAVALGNQAPDGAKKAVRKNKIGNGTCWPRISRFPCRAPTPHGPDQSGSLDCSCPPAVTAPVC